jgi:outer membrane protein assembly factor BamA
VGFFQRSYDIPYPVITSQGGIAVVETRFQTFKEQYPLFSVSLSGDTTRFKEFGPYHGKRFEITSEYAPSVSGDGQPFANDYLDYRAYAHLTRRSLIAWRLFSAISNTSGDTSPLGNFVFSIGGFNQIRGYGYREFFGNRVAFSNLELRFPLVDELRFPFGAIRMLRGFLFFDVGAAWFNGDRWYDPNYGTVDLPVQDPNNPSGFIIVPRKFDFYDSGNNMMGDGRASYGVGLSWFLGPFELTWTWAKRLENSIVVPGPVIGPSGYPTTWVRIPDPSFQSGVQQSFYIGTSF